MSTNTSTVKVRRAPMSGQHTVETLAGPAVLTRIASVGPKGGRVFEYEIETGFNGARTRLHYGYASYAVAVRGVERLAQAHIEENPGPAKHPHPGTLQAVS